MEFRILGPLEVRDGDRVLPLPGVRQRALLSILLLHANELLPAPVLIELLWGDRPPSSAAKGLQVHVSELRKLIGKESIETRAKPVADIEQGYISTASCILANLSMKLGRSLAWDAAAGKIAGDEQANGLLKRAYRGPWKHPGDA